ncbi:MAG: SHOCT domain-containing protein [Solirubrobacterales bacterium]
MAQTVVISGSHGTAKIRDPWGVLGLTLLTLGIYHLYWWYQINKELMNYGIAKQRDLGTSPGLSLLAIWFGAYTLFIATVWTIVGTSRRIRRGQELAGVERLDPGIATLLWIFTLGLGALVYYQFQLNRVWQSPGQTVPHLPASIGVAPVANPDLDRLKQLSDLKEAGSLSEAEFEAEKARLGLGSQTP